MEVLYGIMWPFSRSLTLLASITAEALIRSVYALAFPSLLYLELLKTIYLVPCGSVAASAEA